MTEKFRGQLAVINMDDDGTTVDIGVIDDPEVVVTTNVEQLRGAGSIEWQDLQQTELEVGVTGTVAEWNLDTWKTQVGYDEAQDTIDDTAEVPTWTTEVIYEDTSGDEAVFPVQECYSEDVTVGGSREEWIGMDLDFTGKTVSNVDSNSTTAGSV